jgi:NADPH:quinone reductase-like Zn-dependent oxidoreductase
MRRLRRRRPRTREAPLPAASGFWTERVLLTAAHVAPCPCGLEPVDAAALPVNGLTAGQALAMLGVGREQRPLVTNGAGNTGSLAIQLAAAMGVEVTTDRMLILGERHLRHALAEYAHHYNGRRPHRSLDLQPPRSDRPPVDPTHQRFKRRPVLGGLITEYERAA